MVLPGSYVVIRASSAVRGEKEAWLEHRVSGPKTGT